MALPVRVRDDGQGSGPGKCAVPSRRVRGERRSGWWRGEGWGEGMKQGWWSWLSSVPRWSGESDGEVVEAVVPELAEEDSGGAVG